MHIHVYNTPLIDCQRIIYAEYYKLKYCNMIKCSDDVWFEIPSLTGPIEAEILVILTK